MHAFPEIGATRLVHAWRYAEVGEFARVPESLSDLIPAAREPEIARPVLRLLAAERDEPETGVPERSPRQR